VTKSRAVRPRNANGGGTVRAFLARSGRGPARAGGRQAAPAAGVRAGQAGRGGRNCQKNDGHPIDGLFQLPLIRQSKTVSDSESHVTFVREQIPNIQSV
jgi:hypothetical protein